jgi:hypothetical protein
MNGMMHPQAMEAAGEAFLNPCEPTTIDVVMEAQVLWQRYMRHMDGFPGWEPLGTEIKLELPLTPTINMAIKYDFYFRDTATGKCYVLDYKTSYEFWSQEDHDLNAQMPKYIGVMRANGYQVDGGILEEVRTRKLGAEKQRDPKNLFRRTFYRPSAPLIAAVLKQHIQAALDIEKHRELSEEERLEASLPVLNKHGVCKYCNFTSLCRSMLEGKKDLSVDIRIGYTQSTYTEQYNNNENSGVDFL